MYQNNKFDYIAEVQRYLSAVNSSPLPISGIIDLNTTKAITDFKKSRGLAPDSTVDKVTFDLLYREFGEAFGNTHSFYILEEFPEINKYSVEMSVINKMLEEVLRSYGIHVYLRAAPLYSKETEAALASLCGICGMERESIKDKELILRLKKEYDAHIKLDDI